MSSSEWYQNADAVVAQVRRATAARGPAPSIAGYDDFIELKRGGQGIVYAATQRSTHRRVAIKLLLDGAFASDVNRRRFEREIELVGALRNPNIVQIYDSGLATDGHPYFVMEFVDGAPLDRFVVESGLANPAAGRDGASAADGRARIERLLQLFLPICQAVQYAHQRGVIHRDLKPGNIRVDSDGAPRVLDFGLARGGPGSSALTAEHTELTASGQFMGSLPWASPEHAAGNPDAIDTRSDIYSLGVVLHYLLTGQFPYAVEGALRDVLNNIAHAEPRRPSESAAGVSADLDTIVLKCLAKSPERRYQSVADLAQDIRHYLAGEPIQARRDSAWYTLGKRLQRYRWAVGAAGVVAVVVAIALVISLAQWRVAAQERQIANVERAAADAQRKLAEQKAAQLQVVNDLLADTFSSADPATQGKDVRVADVLDLAVEKVDRDLSDQPLIAHAARVAIGRSFLALGLLDRADAQLAAAARLAAEHLPPDSVDALMGAQWLAALREQQGQYAEAEELLRTTIERSERTGGADNDVAQRARQALANLLGGTGQVETAVQMTRELVATRTAAYGEDDARTLHSQGSLASLLSQAGKLEEAQRLLEQLLESRRRVGGEDEPEYVHALSELSHVQGERGDLPGSDASAARAYELAVKLYGAEHPTALNLLHDRGVAKSRLKKSAEAIAIFREALAGLARTLPENNPTVLNARCSLATELSQSGQQQEALALYREVAETATRIYGRENPQTIVFNSNYAMQLLRLQRVAEGEAILRDVYDAAINTFGEKHWKTATFRGNLGRAYILQKRFEETEPHFLGAYDVLRAALGDHELTAAAAGDLVELYEAWGKPERAAPFRAAASASGGGY